MTVGSRNAIRVKGRKQLTVKIVTTKVVPDKLVPKRCIRQSF